MARDAESALGNGVDGLTQTWSDRYVGLLRTAAGDGLFSGNPLVLAEDRFEDLQEPYKKAKVSPSLSNPPLTPVLID